MQCTRTCTAATPCLAAGRVMLQEAADRGCEGRRKGKGGLTAAQGHGRAGRVRRTRPQQQYRNKDGCCHERTNEGSISLPHRARREVSALPHLFPFLFRVLAGETSRRKRERSEAREMAKRYRPPSETDDAASVFFDLANASAVKYKCRSGTKLVIDQDSNISNCTGGIVWETALLLATFLEGRGVNQLGWSGPLEDGARDGCGRLNAELPASGKSKRAAAGEEAGDRPAKKRKDTRTEDPASRIPRVLEVGAGCGLLGLVLAHMGAQVVLTETAEAMAVLSRNVSKKRCQEQLPPAASAQVLKVDWTSEKDTSALEECGTAPFDVIVGTDVIFNAKLVEPLLTLLHRVSHAETTVWLCMQERCAEAHKTLLVNAPRFFEVHDCSAHLGAAPGCTSAQQLDCFLFCLTGRRHLASE